jgi:ubiquinone/menaquinone biosynthesis C-methylase UbiE
MTAIVHAEAPSGGRAGTLEREAQFHDALAAELDPAQLAPCPPDRLEVATLEIAGDIRGLDVLELGCGQGDLTLQLLERGSRLTALDVSAGMVAVAKRRAEIFVTEAPAHFEVGDAQATGFPDKSFDLIVGKWIVHHLDVEAIARETRRLLRPSGQALFIENQATNPVLRLTREHVAGRFGIPFYGTEDEHPLLEADFQILARHFPRVVRRYPDFCCLQLFDRQVLRQRWGPATSAFRQADLLIERRLPALRRYGYRVILQLGG